MTEDIELEYDVPDIIYALAEVFSSIWARWGLDRLDHITCGRTVNPDSATATVELTPDNQVEPSNGGCWRDDPMSARVGEVRVLYRPYQTVLTGEQVSGSVSSVEALELPIKLQYAIDCLGVAVGRLNGLFLSSN